MNLRLPPHHLERIIEFEKKGPLSRAFFSAIVRIFYGRETYSDYRRTFQRAKAGEEISITPSGFGDICTNCSYREPCIAGDYDIEGDYEKVSKIPFFALAKNVDEGPSRRLKLDKSKTYKLNDFL